MSVRVTGILNDAGEVASPNTHIKFITVKGYGSTLKSAPLEVMTGTDGRYDFQLAIGEHVMSIRYAEQWEICGKVIVNSDTPATLDLDGLLKQTQPLTPAELEQMRQYLVDANAAKEAAIQSANDSAASANVSGQEAGKSKQSAIEAKEYRDQTAAIATGGTATLEPEPGKIPLADQHGHIDDGWLNAATFARSESDMMADRARNNQLFAASGHIHAGKHRNDVNPVYGRPIQDGLWTYLNNSNVLRLGAYKELSSVEGDSKTYESVFNFSGVTAHLNGLNSAYENAQLTLPPAPKGTEVYDSDTGVLTNFETAIDPKYGDVAADANEAVARAFEGLVKNGDMRLGDIGVWENPYPLRGTVDIIDGLLVVTDTVSDPAGCHAVQTINLTAGVEYEVGFILDSVEGTSNTTLRNFVQSTAAGNANYLITDIDIADLKPGKLYTAKFTPTDTSGHRIILYAPSQAGTAKYSYVYLRKATESVVTSPVDLVGFEIFLRPITESDPFIYPYGMQQSKLTSIDGIPTVENNGRPITHFEVYPGDTSSRGRGWSLLDGSLTDAQKAKIFQNTAHNVYRMNDGTLAQWTVSQRTIRGAGNGDWEAIFASGSGDLSLCYKNKANSLVTARGALDSALSASYSNSYRRPPRVSLNSNDLGIWKLIETNAASVAKNNECYFYVIATVPRLNQGAYHPEWNPKGTASGWKNNGSGRAPWHDPLITQFVSPASCFKSSNDSSGADGGYDPTTGKLGGRTDRPDGLLHDVIYASGLNGVIDHRPKYGAWNASSAEQAAVVRQEVKDGKYRGREKLKRWMISEGVPSASSSNMYIGSGFGIGDGEVYLASKSVVDMGYKAWVYIADAGDTTLSGVVTGEWYVCTAFSRNYQGQVTLLNPITGNNTWITAGTTASMKIIIGIDVEITTTVESEFTQTDVIGNPANILQSPFKNGWLGGWIPVIPAGTSVEYPLTEKGTATSALTMLISADNGVTWSTSSASIDVNNNSWRATLTSEKIAYFSYKAESRPTMPSINLPVFGGDLGLSSVFHSSHNAINLGCLLSKSVLNNVLKGASNYLLGNAALQNLGTFDSSGKLYTPSGLVPTHSALNQNGTGTENNSPAGKFLFHQIDESGQANLNIIANELIYSSTGGNWGDDAKLKIVADGTFTDLNGNKCKAAIHKLVKSYGFIKM
ncbi:hypothetical protein [Vibrio fluvialis]|uniref:hypothetical protein n=1 Tax=Vibrio fluvialis TaxID=676 RepID=UPI0039997B32